MNRRAPLFAFFHLRRTGLTRTLLPACLPPHAAVACRHIARRLTYHSNITTCLLCQDDMSLHALQQRTLHLLRLVNIQAVSIKHLPAAFFAATRLHADPSCSERLCASGEQKTRRTKTKLERQTKSLWTFTRDTSSPSRRAHAVNLLRRR